MVNIKKEQLNSYKITQNLYDVQEFLLFVHLFFQQFHIIRLKNIQALKLFKNKILVAAFSFHFFYTPTHRYKKVKLFNLFKPVTAWDLTIKTLTAFGYVNNFLHKKYLLKITFTFFIILYSY